MTLKNINKILTEANKLKKSRLLFTFQFGKIRFKCIILVENRVLMFTLLGHSLGHSVNIDDHGDILSYIPNEIYALIVPELQQKYNNKKINLLWNDIDVELSQINIKDKFEINDDDIKDMVKTFKIERNEYDPDGDKPFFQAWVRNNKRRLSEENNKKTARYFGNKIARLCWENNISSRWGINHTDKSLCFLNLKNVEKEINNNS